MSYKYVSPKFLNDGCVLSLIASKANKGSAPTSSTVVWSDQSSVRNKIPYKNGVPNPTFASKTNWADVGNGFTYTESGGEVTVTNLGSSASSYKLYVTTASYQVVSGRKYYVRTQMKSTQATTYRIACAGNSGSGQSSQHTGGGTYEPLSCLTTAGGTGNSDFRFISTTATGDITATPLYIKEPLIVDLTEIGLAHLNLTQCDELFAYTATEATATLANDVTLNNLGQVIGSVMGKVAVVNGNGDSVQYSNGVTNSLFSNTTGWALSPAQHNTSVADGELSITGLGTSQYLQPNNTTTLLATNTHRIYSRVEFYIPTEASNAQIILNAGVSQQFSSAVKTEWKTLSGILAMTGQTPGNAIKFYASTNYPDAATSNGKVSKFRKPFIINLSDNLYIQALEAKLGRVITVDECDRLFTFTAGTNTVVIDTQYALSLDATDDYGTLPSTPSLDITTNELALACTFRVAVGASIGVLLSRSLKSAGSAHQYTIYWDNSNKRLYAYFNSQYINPSNANTILENVWYNAILYRNSAGLVTLYINKVSAGTQTYTNALISQPNSMLGGVSNADAGTSSTSRFKGDIATQSVYQAPTLDINKIIARETAIAKDYTGVA